ncbi:MAG: NAD(+) diphosphatase [Rhodospirillales bacterium]
MGGNLSYTGVALDRAAVSRHDDAWFAERLAADGARIVPVWRDHSLVRPGESPDGAPGAMIFTGGAGKAILAEADQVAILGMDGDVAYFAADVSGLDDDAAAALAGGGAFEDLRRVGALMAGPEAALLAYARGIVHWHQRHRFCGTCGAATESRNGGHVRRCVNPEEAHDHFPRTDPAVIMLVSHDDPDGRGPACLLGRQSRWPDGMYSTLAGFVEPGESLEEAVIREVREETGVVATEVRYRASQPWPFPSSLMLGFRARAETTAIQVHDQELEDARWFTPVEVRTFGEWGAAPPGEKRLPRKDSISRWLIEGWLTDHGA